MQGKWMFACFGNCGKHRAIPRTYLAHEHQNLRNLIHDLYPFVELAKLAFSVVTYIYVMLMFFKIIA